MLDAFGTILDVSRQYYDITGYQYPDLIQKNLHDIEVLTTPEDIIQQNQRIRDLGWDNFKTLHRGKDNRIIEFDVEVVFLNIYGGRFFRFFREVASTTESLFENPRPKQITSPSTNRILLNLNKIVREAVELQYAILPEGVRIEEHLDPIIWLTKANRLQILQVLMNLITNSLEALAEHGRIEIRTSNMEMNQELAQAFPQMKPGHYVFCTVEDDGCGINQKLTEKIFEPFITTKPGGRGMGLFSANRNINDHNGFITVRSQPGQGSTFSVYLPATRVPSNETQPIHPVIPTGIETLLIIDAQTIHAGETKKMLETLAYHVLLAHNIQEAQEIIQNYAKDIHAVILDAQIGQASNFDILTFIRKRRPNIKILLAGANDIDASAQNALEAGANSFVAKPFQVEVLAPTIRDILDH